MNYRCVTYAHQNPRTSANVYHTGSVVCSVPPCPEHRADHDEAFGFLGGREIRAAGFGNLGLHDRESRTTG